jgi:hypothetical protein
VNISTLNGDLAQGHVGGVAKFKRTVLHGFNFGTATADT